MHTREFNWSAYDRWENRTESAAYDDPLKRCRDFPICDCSYCHDYHIEIKYFEAICSKCQDERCNSCDGTGWELTDGNAQCEICKNSGRIKT